MSNKLNPREEYKIGELFPIASEYVSGSLRTAFKYVPLGKELKDFFRLTTVLHQTFGFIADTDNKNIRAEYALVENTIYELLDRHIYII